MDARVQEVFGQPVVDVLVKHRFRRIGGIDDGGWFTRDFVNGDLGVHLIYHLSDKEFSVTPADQLGIHYHVSTIMRYFGENEWAGASLEAEAHFFDRHYRRIHRMLARRDGGADLKGLRRCIRDFNRANFGLDEPKDAT